MAEEKSKDKFVRSGMGLIKCGSVVIPFDNQISKDTDLYRLYNTNIHEKIAEEKRRKQREQSVCYLYEEKNATVNRINIRKDKWSVCRRRSVQDTGRSFDYLTETQNTATVTARGCMVYAKNGGEFGAKFMGKLLIK